jgi:hypothetical protein
MECKRFKVCAFGADADADSVLDDMISLRIPSDKNNGLHLACQLTQGKNERAFLEKLEECAEDHPRCPQFNKTTFTLVRDDYGRWVHKPRYSRTSSVSDYFSFHLQDQFFGVKPKPVATPKAPPC